jgi:hypothetical protein
MSAPRSIRFDQDVLARLDLFVRENPGTSLSAVANMFVDESLRSHEHTGIVFRSGPTGRRAGLAGGPDVWEVIGALHAVRGEQPELEGDALLTELTGVTGLNAGQISAALRYYSAYAHEIDERIEANRRAAERAESLWRAERELLGRRGS